MSTKTTAIAVVVLACCTAATIATAAGQDDRRRHEGQKKTSSGVQVGPRPYYLVEKMNDSPLKRKLESCSEGPFKRTDFSIGHRGGGTLQFPEHTKESHEAGARMGAGILECDGRARRIRPGKMACCIGPPAVRQGYSSSCAGHTGRDGTRAAHRW